MSDINNVRECLIKKTNKDLKMLIGLDGFVDEIIHVVDKRENFENFTRVKTIAELGERITNASGLSTNIELVTKQVKLGGNGPIFANALLESGVDLTYIGSLGEETIHPVFASMAEKAKVYSVCDPGHTDALEFEDGKLMLGKIVVINSITWENIKNKVGGEENFVNMVKESDLFGMENWTMIAHMSEIWESIINDVFPKLPDKPVKTIAFFDLADPEKRTKEDILKAMGLISRFEEKFRAVLGLNEKEAYEIAEVFGISIDSSLSDSERLKQVTEAVYEKLNIYCLVVHPRKEAVACCDKGYFHAKGPYCEKPVLTTGAGDNFNAGFCLGLSLGLEVSQALVMGVGTSGFYVRNAKSPSREELIMFLDSWDKGNI